MSETLGRELWGAETRKAVANFPVSGEPIPAPVARWLGRIKAAAALMRPSQRATSTGIGSPEI